MTVEQVAGVLLIFVTLHYFMTVLTVFAGKGSYVPMGREPGERGIHFILKILYYLFKDGFYGWKFLLVDLPVRTIRWLFVPRPPHNGGDA